MRTLTIGDPATVGALRPSYASVVLTDSPVAFWPMQEASGDLADTVGGRTATKAGSGGVTYAVDGPAAGVKAVEFDGSSGVGFSAADDDLWSAMNFTVEAWAYLGSSFFSGQYARYLTGKHAGSGNSEFFVQVEDTAGGRLTAQVSNTVETNWANKLLGSWGPPTESWHHIVMVLSGSTVTLYVDGVSVGSSGSTSGSRRGNSAGVFGIGHNPAVASRSWKGRICMAAFYSTALSSGQVTAHYGAM